MRQAGASRSSKKEIIAAGSAMGLNRLIPNTVESVDKINEPAESPVK